jgi:ubiquinone/menaquinone biosynthesis C-methylase UbiE
MNPNLVPYLRSPETGNELEIKAFMTKGDEVLEGILVDRATGVWFRIADGIADLKPLALRTTERYDAFKQRHCLDESLAAQRPAVQDGIVADQQKQINFFDRRPEEYEKEVVRNPFSRVLDNVTFGDWAKRTLKPGSRVLEIGCGSGRQTEVLIRLGMRSVALDLSEGLLRLARHKLEAQGIERGADLIASSAEALPIANGNFDACVIYGSLHHFASPQIVLAKATAALRRGGHFYMLEPHKSPIRFLFDWLMRVHPLWQEEASDDPLFSEPQFREWLGRGNVRADIKFSTYLPPHLFYHLGQTSGERLLMWSDRLFSSLPGVRRLSGVIIAEGVKV